MAVPTTLAPGVPADYYRQIHEVELGHWWYRGMREISRSLLAGRVGPATTVLDGGCGTGGTLRWLLDGCGVKSAAGVDIASAAVELARVRAPEADIRVAPLGTLPFADASFSLVVTNDVLQHVPEDDVKASLHEVRRVLRPGGTLLLRTNGSRRLRRARADWRAYDRNALRQALEAAGFRCERVTYANMILSAWGALTARTPQAPSEERHGIPRAASRGARSAVGLRLLRAEARWLAHDGRSLPYGHTLFALAVPVS